MVTSKQCFAKYGEPSKETYMVLWDVPTALEIGVIPKRIYCNKDMVKPLEKALTNVIKRGLVGELITWNGCFNIRKKVVAASQSLHSWGIAIDINAAWNGYNKAPSMRKELVACFKDAGFDWGGDWGSGITGNWKGCDAMHFQLKALP